jgi:hypothetical protein
MTPRQPTARQDPIDTGQPERHNRAAAPAHRFQSSEPGTQPLEHGASVGVRRLAIDLAGV